MRALVTLAADTGGGNRPSFTGAAPPDEGRRLYERVLQLAREQHPIVVEGRFAAHIRCTWSTTGP